MWLYVFRSYLLLHNSNLFFLENIFPVNINENKEILSQFSFEALFLCHFVSKLNEIINTISEVEQEFFEPQKIRLNLNFIYGLFSMAQAALSYGKESPKDLNLKYYCGMVCLVWMKQKSVKLQSGQSTVGFESRTSRIRSQLTYCRAVG